MNIKENIKRIIEESLNDLNFSSTKLLIERPKNIKFGNYTTNIALLLAKELKINPFLIAQKIKEGIKKNNLIEKIDVIKPGFINIYLSKDSLLEILPLIIKEKDNFGKSNLGKNKKINIEFASVNPTGLLHLGHARGSAYGDNISRLLSFVGFNVTKEYYINDGGNQIDNLGISIKERYKELCGMKFKIPEDGYFGAEIKNIAEKIYINNNNKYIDKPLDYFKDIGVSELINKIRIDLENFRIKFDVWTSEKEIRKGGKIEETLNKLKILNKTYEKENALWLKSSIYGDEKDRVLIKKDGEYTYLTPDIAYHLDKFDRGFQNLINVFGADHHGYVPRLKAGVEALGYNKEQLEVKIVQMVRLLKGREEIKMSKRTGNVVTLEDLLEEVGVDSVRYFFAMRNIDTQMDFDIDLALKKSNENPFYYVGYAHARICSILKEIKKDIYCNKFTTIKDEYAYNMIAKLHEFSDVIKISALKNAPHLITNYLYDLANLFHIYYTNEKIIVEDEKMLKERIMLITAVKIVIKNGLNLIGVEAPQKM